MKNKNILNLFSSESVSEGHPDKLCDQISDAVLDEALRQDPSSRTAVECLATRECIIISGEVTTKAKLDYVKIARDVARKIGYTDDAIGLDADRMEVQVHVIQQSPDIAQGVDSSLDDHQIGAGDQGIMFGYATDETENYMPLPLVMAHKLVRVASNLRHEGKLPHSRPDMKSQVTVNYTGKEPTINAIVFSCQHDEKIAIEALRKEIMDEVIDPVILSFGFQKDPNFQVFINPTGRFVVGGPAGDTGLTGRKIIVDTYGGSAPHGGGAFSGKDPTKVDRSAAYAARYAAKNIVAAGLAKRALIELSYAIGVSEPVSISLETYGTETVDKDLILSALVEGKIFDFTPSGIIRKFDLRHPDGFSYEALARYGHFGRPDLRLPWEKLDEVEKLKKYCSKR